MGVRRLPIKSLGPPGMYPVLNIDVVIRILHERRLRGPDSDWKQILLDCLPDRQKPGPNRGARRKERKAKAIAGNGQEAKTCDDSSSDGSSSEADAGEIDPTLEERSHLKQGTEIEIAEFGHATIISLGLLPHGQHKGKYKVRYPDGKLYHISPHQISNVGWTSPP